MNIDPKCALVNDYKNINKLLISYRYIPLIDEHKNIVDIISNENNQQNYSLTNPVIIMAGGEGKRLLPLTLNKPKPLLPVNQKPLIHEIVNRLDQYGLKDIYISVFYKADMIKEYFKELNNSGFNIKFLEEDKPLGTAGCLSLLKKKNILDPIIVVNGDVLTDMNYRQLIDYHNKSKKLITICAAIYDIQIPFGTIELDEDKLANIVEKPIKKYLINAGIYIINPVLLNDLQDNTAINMTDIIENNIKNKSVGIFPIHEQWLDIGNHKDYEKTQK
jgi:NDP-sugar pyrophosphorylase family protein